MTQLPAYAQINTDQVMQVGRNALYFEDYMLSIQYFNQVIAAKPYLAQPYFFRAIAKYNLDDFHGAISDASKALEQNPFLLDAYELRAVANQNIGNVEEALTDYDKVLGTLPENRVILFNKALAYEELKRYDESAATFDQLLAIHSGFDGGYVGRARLRLEQKDTVGALADVEKALELNKRSVNAYLIRADVAINSHRDYSAALDDMNEAIRLQPKYPGFYINRAFLRHNLDDYYGALSDYEYAIQLDPEDYTGYFNRALLLCEVRDFDKALVDLNKVLALRGTDYRALYNRALVLKEKRDFKGALADINTIIAAYPNLAAGYFLRSEIRRDMGDMKAKEDFDRSLALARGQKAGASNHDGGQKQPDNRNTGTAHPDTNSNAPAAGDEPTPFDKDFEEIMRGAAESPDKVMARFTSLLTVNDNTNIEQEFINKSIRGRVQNRNVSISYEPIFTASYYNSPTELRPNPEYIKEVDDINRTRALRFLLQVTNSVPSLDDEDQIKRHFDSVNYYNSYLSTHKPRAIDYFGRAMDLLTLRNYDASIADFNRALELTPDFTMAYFMRGIARLQKLESEAEENAKPQGEGRQHPMTSAPIPGAAMQQLRAKMAEVMADIDKVIELSPEMPVAFYNKGVVLLQMQDYTSALKALNRAIELKPDFGEAYYNRGYVYYMLGDRTKGSADVSKAGELGVVPSYNLLKRMNR
ncbi:MAG: tetratricopeptide repeat protein [Paramuribaculum sp.]|nr:tetratricopeptide repeat protein [Paramuribaculum sp.]